MINDFYNMLKHRFDEVINEKASKMALDEIYTKLLDYTHRIQYTKDIRKTREDCEKLEEHVTKVEDLLYSFERRMTDETRLTVKRELNQMRLEIKQNNGENNVDWKTFNSIIRTKISRDELWTYLGTKSNVSDTDANMKATDIIHKQIKHITAILLEVLNSFRTPSAKNNENQFQILYSQGLNLLKWIFNFDPENINTLDLKLPKELHEFQNFMSTQQIEFGDSFLSRNISQSPIKYAKLRHLNKSATPKTTTYSNSIIKKLTSKSRWAKFMLSKRKSNKTDSSSLSRTIPKVNELNNSSYNTSDFKSNIFINEAQSTWNNREGARSKTSNANRSNSKKMIKSSFNL